MPDKDGDDDKKSTKSVVTKRQKQMMGEEGYDVARDMGRVKPSKDKKDATTMPPSKEMEKTRKVNKGPSALERVKKKYEGQIMDMKKEELDLTQVAEAFGGYIVEAPVEDREEKKNRAAKKLGYKQILWTGNQAIIYSGIKYHQIQNLFRMNAPSNIFTFIKTLIYCFLQTSTILKDNKNLSLSYEKKFKNFEFKIFNYI